MVSIPKYDTAPCITISEVISHPVCNDVSRHMNSLQDFYGDKTHFSVRICHTINNAISQPRYSVMRLFGTHDENVRVTMMCHACMPCLFVTPCIA